MKREDLLKTKEYWMVQIQNDLYGAIEEYMSKMDFDRTKLANKLNVTKGYITQIFKGDFDHKLSKMVELSLASDKVPFVKFIDIDDYIENDANDKFYGLIPMHRPKNVTLKTSTQTRTETTGKFESTKFTPYLGEVLNYTLPVTQPVRQV